MTQKPQTQTQKPQTSKDAADKVVKNIRRKTRQTYSSEEKIRIVLAGLRGEESIAVLCRRAGIAESLYYSWSKEFLEAGTVIACNHLSGNSRRTSPPSRLPAGAGIILARSWTITAVTSLHGNSAQTCAPGT